MMPAIIARGASLSAHKLRVRARGARALHTTTAPLAPSPSFPSRRPWLYASHPFRLETVGSGANLTTAAATIRKQGWFGANTGWSYGVINFAFLGFAQQAYAMVLDRARQPPPPGYRFPAFAAHYQDYLPSADHYSVMNTAVNAMLMQPGEDGEAGSIVLLPAWPCDVDVHFKLWGVLNTSVEVVWAGGALVSLDVQPPARAGAVRFAPCGNASAERFPIFNAM